MEYMVQYAKNVKLTVVFQYIIIYQILIKRMKNKLNAQNV